MGEEVPSACVSNFPHIVRAHGKTEFKGEDVLLAHPEESPSSDLAFFILCDGHDGADCARFVTSNFNACMCERLPTQLPDFDVELEVTRYAAAVRTAILETFVSLDEEWALRKAMSGTTVTLVFVTGWLVTVANVGDSTALLDDGIKVFEMTNNHRFERNILEQKRILEGGGHLARLAYSLRGPAKPGEHGLGPLRLWPGGLCVARGIGDLIAGAMVVPIPHIKQVLVPKRGCRLIMASDGLWDVLTAPRVARIARAKLPSKAVSTLIRSAKAEARLTDDLSLVVIDILPSRTTTFPAMCRDAQRESKAGQRRGSIGSMLACLYSPAIAEHTELQGMVFNGDCLKHYPEVGQRLARAGVRINALDKVGREVREFPMHGGGEAGYNVARGMRGPASRYTL